MYVYFQVQVYVNGTLTYTSSIPAPGPKFTSNFSEFQSFLIGQEPDVFAGGFDSTQSFDGFLDEVRMWNTVRNERDILENWNRSLVFDDANVNTYVNANLYPNLILYYNFDNINPKYPTIVPDLSPVHANHAQLGFLPFSKQIATYSSADKIDLQLPPSKPRLIPVCIHTHTHTHIYICIIM